MTPPNEPFQLEQVDAQLDALARAASLEAATASETANSRTYQQLSQLFAPQAAAEARAIERVRERLASAASASSTSASASVFSPASPLAFSAELRSRELPSALPPARRGTPLPRRAASRGHPALRGVAATIVVAMFLGAFAILRRSGWGSPAANNYRWTRIPSPNTTVPVNYLTGITMRTASDGWAWGIQSEAPSNLDSNPIATPLVEHWDGHQWSIVATPAMPFGGELTDVVSLAPDNAWAVGDRLITSHASQDTTGGSVIEHWDGHTWTMLADPTHPVVNVANTRLAQLAALSPTDIWAVGAYSAATDSGIIVHWDGQRWSEVSHPSPARSGGFTAIAAVASNDIWVVGGNGHDGKSTFEHWNGQQWQMVSGPSANITSISAVSANDIWAVGWQKSLFGLWQDPVIEHWDGRQWSAVSSAAGYHGVLSNVAALGPNDVWAVGTQPPDGLYIDIQQQGSGLIEHWDGQQWSCVDNPNPKGYTSLGGVAGDPATPGKVWVAGLTGPAQTRGDQFSATQTLIETGQ